MVARKKKTGSGGAARGGTSTSVSRRPAARKATRTSSAGGKKVVSSRGKKTATRKTATRKTAARKTAARKKTAGKKAAGSVRSGAAARSRAPRSQSGPARRRNPRLIQNLLLLSPAELEEHFERVQPEEVVTLFQQSYPSDLVNLLLGLKRSTCRRLFEIVTRHGRRSHLDTITLYYYKDYLTNPLPLELHARDGSSLPNYYAIVGMARDASEEEISEASRLLTRAFSPSSFPPADRKLGDVRYREIKAAFERLRSPQRRQEVNRLLPSINYYYPRRDQSWLDMVQRFSG